MNYYDYRPYFNDIESLLSDVKSELISQHDDIIENFELLTSEVNKGFALIAALIVLATAIKVMFK